jgi:hypothetical protein
MRVFEYWGSREPYAEFLTAPEDQALWRREFHGESRLAQWSALRLQRALDAPGQPRPTGPIADVTTVNSVIKNCVWSPRARRALEPHVGHCGEFLPLICDEAKWVLFNVTRVIDALDEAASEVIYYDEQRKSGRFVRMVFKPEALAGEIIFRIPQRSSSDIFVTDAFVRLIEAQGLVGFELKPVWSDEDPASA